MAIPTDNKWPQIFLVTVVVLLAAGVVAHLVQTTPTAKRQRRPNLGLLVETVKVTKATATPTIRANGRLTSPNRVQLRSQVAGQVRAVSAKLMPGETVQKGDLLVRIDPRDAQNQLSRAKAARRQASAALEQEDGSRSVAKLESELLKDILTEEDKRLATREPQFEAARAALDAAQAQVKDAQLALTRTKIRAPMNALVLSRQVGVGDVLSPGTIVSELAGIDRWWVRAEIPIADLAYVQNGADAKIKLPTATVWREAKVAKVISASPPGIQMAQVLLEVDEPLKQVPGAPLLVDTLVEVEMSGREVIGIFELPRRLLRPGNTVWVKNSESKLEIRNVAVDHRGRDTVFISSGLKEGDSVVTSPIATPVAGMVLRDKSSPAGDAGSKGAP